MKRNHRNICNLKILHALFILPFLSFMLLPAQVTAVTTTTPNCDNLLSTFGLQWSIVARDYGSFISDQGTSAQPALTAVDILVEESLEEAAAGNYTAIKFFRNRTPENRRSAHIQFRHIKIKGMRVDHGLESYFNVLGIRRLPIPTEAITLQEKLSDAMEATEDLGREFFPSGSSAFPPCF